jgi:chemotaxis protein methyltransferase CheR
MTANNSYGNIARPMSAREFNRLSEFIHSQCGIKMPPGKKIMLESRLQKRLKTLGISCFREYCQYLFDGPEGKAELIHMIDAVTTNKTGFFREPTHFTYLVNTALPLLLQDKEKSHGCTVWSAGCSSGEEPYTLGMVLSEFASRQQGFQFSIVATDISTKILDKARLGIYEQELVADVPPLIKLKYFMRSKDRIKGLVRIVPTLRSLVRFERLNLMDESYAFSGPVDVIFCRNVIIYFDRETQYKLLDRLCRCLRTGGYLFLGHSESVHGFDLPIARMAATVFRKSV